MDEFFSCLTLLLAAHQVLKSFYHLQIYFCVLFLFLIAIHEDFVLS